MKVTMEIPDPPAGCDTPKWTRLGLPIGERVWVLVAKDWWQAESFISTGGNYWIACNMQLPEKIKEMKKCKCCGTEITSNDRTDECPKCGRMQCVHCDVGPETVCEKCEEEERGTE